MSSKSRQSREQHSLRGESEAPAVKPSKATRKESASTERTSGGGALSHRLAKSSLPLRRGQRSS
ncbi:hypothetical protein ACFXJ8_24965 [Nonomuraea sp. NPDC059194]|uniref:hypothetical protein n=1 Tax=Nonomuraea sp. NPDC059194 TaxID=3346764 RepID=UPI00367B3456